MRLFSCGSLLPGFRVRVLVTFHFMFVHIILVRLGFLSGHLLGKSFSLSRPFVLFVVLLFVIFVISRFGFDGRICVPIALVPGHCLLVTFRNSPTTNLYRKFAQDR